MKRYVKRVISCQERSEYYLFLLKEKEAIVEKVKDKNTLGFYCLINLIQFFIL